MLGERETPPASQARQAAACTVPHVMHTRTPQARTHRIRWRIQSAHCLLAQPDVVGDHRGEIMGAPNPAEAAEGTLRKLYADSIGNNAVHGSDAPETAAVEMNYFFNAFELH